MSDRTTPTRSGTSERDADASGGPRGIARLWTERHVRPRPRHRSDTERWRWLALALLCACLLTVPVLPAAGTTAADTTTTADGRTATTPVQANTVPLVENRTTPGGALSETLVTHEARVGGSFQASIVEADLAASVSDRARAERLAVFEGTLAEQLATLQERDRSFRRELREQPDVDRSTRVSIVRTRARAAAVRSLAEEGNETVASLPENSTRSTGVDDGEFETFARSSQAIVENGSEHVDGPDDDRFDEHYDGRSPFLIDDSEGDGFVHDPDARGDWDHGTSWGDDANWSDGANWSRDQNWTHDQDWSDDANWSHDQNWTHDQDWSDDANWSDGANWNHDADWNDPDGTHGAQARWTDADWEWVDRWPSGPWGDAGVDSGDGANPYGGHGNWSDGDGASTSGDDWDYGPNEGDGEDATHDGSFGDDSDRSGVGDDSDGATGPARHDADASDYSAPSDDGSHHWSGNESWTDGNEPSTAHDGDHEPYYGGEPSTHDGYHGDESHDWTGGDESFEDWHAENDSFGESPAGTESYGDWSRDAESDDDVPNGSEDPWGGEYADDAHDGWDGGY